MKNKSLSKWFFFYFFCKKMKACFIRFGFSAIEIEFEIYFLVDCLHKNNWSWNSKISTIRYNSCLTIFLFIKHRKTLAEWIAGKRSTRRNLCHVKKPDLFENQILKFIVCLNSCSPLSNLVEHTPLSVSYMENRKIIR